MINRGWTFFDALLIFCLTGGGGIDVVSMCRQIIGLAVKNQQLNHLIMNTRRSFIKRTGSTALLFGVGVASTSQAAWYHHIRQTGVCERIAGNTNTCRSGEAGFPEGVRPNWVNSGPVWTCSGLCDNQIVTISCATQNGGTWEGPGSSSGYYMCDSFET